MGGIEGDADGVADATIEAGPSDDWAHTPRGPVEVPASVANITGGLEVSDLVARSG